MIFIKGVAYMLLKLSQINEPLLSDNTDAMKALESLRKSAKRYIKKKRDRSAAFLCGAAGIHVVSAAILDFTKSLPDEKEEDLKALENQLNEGIFRK
jgi:hypothetical protein